MEYRNYWFEVCGEDSEICGEQFFVAVKDPQRKVAMTAEERKAYNKTLKEEVKAIVERNFPDEEVKCMGWVTDAEADLWGLDTY